MFSFAVQMFAGVTALAQHDIKILGEMITVGIPAREMGRYIERCQSTARRYRGALVYGRAKVRIGTKVRLNGAKSRLSCVANHLPSKG